MKTHMFIIINLLTTLMFFTSCKQDAEESFFFKIENGLLEWHVGAEGGQQEYIVESNAPWQIVHKGIGTWAKVSPRRSEGTGSFLITVKENESEEERSVSLAVQLAGKDYPVNITIMQEGTSSEPVPPVEEDYPIVYNSFRIRDPFIFADPVSKNIICMFMRMMRFIQQQLIR
ncbi:BACON domain-containing protein [Bacteroides sp. CR5/BHMF/2]|nr:BACON domain-containing protein [Bacteroides sp. CR5/BHMF/2]